jgi:hypothetical protein
LKIKLLQILIEWLDLLLVKVLFSLKFIHLKPNSPIPQSHYCVMGDGEAVLLQFQLVQHIRNESLIRSISAYLDCGRVTVLTDAVYLHVTKFTDLTDMIIPIFQKYPILVAGGS